MSVPKHLTAFDGRLEDFEWTRIAETSAKPTPTVAPVPPTPTPPATPSLPRMKISPTPISAEELAANLNTYYAAMEKVPGWQELLAEENRKTKEARSEARRAARRKAAT